VSGFTELTTARWDKHGSEKVKDRVARETPIALTYNRRSHVVMMATPADLEDFALGFSLSEDIVASPGELLATRVIERERGLEVAMTVSEDCLARLEHQRRNLTGRTGCGLCGAESLDQAMREPATVSHRLQVRHAALQAAVHALQTPLPVQQATGAVHCAAWCTLEGDIRHAREDVGRHNALDKLIGHLARTGFDAAEGFILVSSRASYEMSYKAASIGVELLLAASAPTALAIDYALRSGLTLVGFARPGRHNVYTFPERIIDQ
jgi:FdhD protein